MREIRFDSKQVEAVRAERVPEREFGMGRFGK